ncbi:hypothetical protein D3C77_515430 [compost metagenome]
MQELGANNATAAENHRNVAVFQIPAILIGSSSHLSKTLGVRYDLTCEQGFANIFNELLFVAIKGGYRRAAQNFACSDALVLHGG